MGASKKYFACSACKHWEGFRAQQLCCGRCGAKYDMETDVSHWKRNWWVRGGSSSPSPNSAKGVDTKSSGKGSSKGAAGKGGGKGGPGANDSCGGTYVSGCSDIYESDMRDLGLDKHDLGMLVYIDGLSRDDMDGMAEVPRHIGWKPLLQRICLRKFPVQDEEKSFDVVSTRRGSR